MNRIKVFEFGPELGPLSGRKPEPVQGKGLVWVGASPLAPGHFVLGPAPLIGVDEPIGGDPGIGGGGGPGIGGGPGGGSGGGGGLPIGWEDEYDGSGGGQVPSEPRPTGPKWAIDPKTGKPYCDEAARKRIEAAYKWLTQSADAYRLISTFDGLGECVADKWRGAPTVCRDLSIPDMVEKSFDEGDRREIDTRPFTFSTRELADASDEFLGMRVLQQLIWRCGGARIDAYAVAILLDPGHAYPLDLEIGMDRVKQTAEFVPANEGGPYYRGKWVIWNHLKGEIYNMNRPGVPIIPSKAWSTRLRNGYRQFWRQP